MTASPSAPLSPGARSRDSIKHRMQRVIILTTATVLAITCSVFIFFEWRNSLLAERAAALSTARITASASSAILAFGNPAEAEKLLSAFRAEPDVLAATLYDSSGNLFAQYRTPGTDQPTPLKPATDGIIAGN